MVKALIVALNDRDIDGYLACCAEDIQVRTPLAAVGGVYDGADGIRRYFADLSDTGPDFRVTIKRLEPISTDQALAFLQVTVSGRASGIPLPADAAAVYDFVEGKIRRVRIFLDRAEALEAVGLRE